MLKAVVGAVAAIGLAVSSFAETIELSTVTADRTLASGDVITGKLGANVKISIAAGAYVILRDATIDGANNASCKWAGLTCEGDASIYIDGENYVRGFYEDYPSIHVPEGKTLTIRQVVGTMGPYGDPLYGGTLTVPGNNYAAGIGAGNGIPCGNIVIESGIIRAAGKVAAGIGGANGAACGDITIKGGVVSATGGWTEPHRRGQGRHLRRRHRHLGRGRDRHDGRQFAADADDRGDCHRTSVREWRRVGFPHRRRRGRDLRHVLYFRGRGSL